MGSIRFLGPARGGRCIYCHDALSGSVRACPECSATWHQDCGEGARRCPTVGCSGPAPGAGSRADDLDAARPRPTEAARREAHERLVASARRSAVFATVSAAFLLWPVVHWTSFWWLCTSLKRTERDPAPGSTAFISLTIAFVVLCYAANWLRQIPGLMREILTLLDDTKPTAMRLTVFTQGTGKNKRTLARLVGGGTDLSLPLDNGLPPDWLWEPDAHQDEPVLVYGHPSRGVYLIELRDGRLALVHPD